MKTFQRFLGIALTMLLMAAFPSTVTAANYNDDELAAMKAMVAGLGENEEIVFFYCTNTWTTINCYCWIENTSWNAEDGSASTSNTWPGYGMTQLDVDGTKIYYYKVTFSPDNVIFTNKPRDDYNNGVQTGNLTWHNGGYYEYTTDDATDCYMETITADDTTTDEPSTDNTGSTVTSTYPSAGLYLVGDFFDDDYNSNDNTAFKYSFRLTKQTDGTYSIMIPATLEGVEFSLVKTDGYGNDIYYGANCSTDTYGFSSTWPSAGGTVPTSDSDKAIQQDGKPWSLSEAHENQLLDDGTYVFAVTLTDADVPDSWTMTHKNNLRIAYFVQNPDEVPNPVMQVAEMYSSNDEGTFNDNYFGYFYLGANKHGYVVSNVLWDEVNRLRKTTSKLYSQGNSTEGIPPTATSGVDDDVNGHVVPKYGYKTSNAKDGFSLSTTSNIATTLEYNPSRAYNYTNEPLSSGTFAGSLLKYTSNVVSDINSVSVIGDITGGWTAGTDEIAMTYNSIEGCYSVTLTTTTDDYETNPKYFRFIANSDWSTNWAENAAADTARAKRPYTSETADGHAATDEDPNYVTLKSSYNSSSDDDTALNIIFNRPAGVWTINFYIKTTTSSNDPTQTYYYTITKEVGDTLNPFYCNRQFICSYSSDVAMDLQDGVRAYVAYSYDDDETEGATIDGTLYMRRMNYVPANVGVVLVADSADVKKYIAATDTLTMYNGQADGTRIYLRNVLWQRTEASATDSAGYCQVMKKYSYYLEQSADADTVIWHNFLLPGGGSTVEIGNVTDSNYGAATLDNDGNVVERYFALSLYSKSKTGKADTSNYTDYFGFFRFNATAHVAKGLAYLYLPSTDEGYGCLTSGGQILSKLSEFDDPSSNSSKRISHMIFDDMDGDEEAETESTTTGITTIEETVVSTGDNAYYTLQGIRVTTPSRGIYIHNGKKIIIR